jgi:hypothetical protein
MQTGRLQLLDRLACIGRGYAVADSNGADLRYAGPVIIESDPP